MNHPIRQTIFESLLSSPKGFELDPKRVPLIMSQLRGDAAATATFYEVCSLLRMTNGVPAALALEKMMLDGALGKVKAKKPGWGT